jgi:hypothetical protein
MSCDPEGSLLPRFSSAYNWRTNSAGSRAGSRRFQSFRATSRVPVAKPARSMNQQVGSRPTTTIEPGGAGSSRETNGWSIHPPAKAMR